MRFLPKVRPDITTASRTSSNHVKHLIVCNLWSQHPRPIPYSHSREKIHSGRDGLSIVSRFGVPCMIITDNGTQFHEKFKNFCANIQISLAQRFVKTPHNNGQVEAINKNILTTLKKKVGEAKVAWLEELLGIL
ncbi:Retrotransposable element Tf2 [Gossypium australe]|uniref:Retrotransposable element Tf2 n=1 Tax=Gossypium australe TaxID=47621 RepID=A0A5B6X065_9ROSI|nr:Retrotransposable element Tf2 [Gossypium australe]